MTRRLGLASWAQAEAASKETKTNRSCLTAEDLKEFNLLVTDSEDCKVTAKKIRGAVADITMRCKSDSLKSETLHYEALSRERMRGTLTMTGDTGSVEMTFTGKWIGATCKE